MVGFKTLDELQSLVVLMGINKRLGRYESLHQPVIYPTFRRRGLGEERGVENGVRRWVWCSASFTYVVDWDAFSLLYKWWSSSVLLVFFIAQTSLLQRNDTCLLSEGRPIDIQYLQYAIPQSINHCYHPPLFHGKSWSNSNLTSNQTILHNPNRYRLTPLRSLYGNRHMLLRYRRNHRMLHGWMR